MEFKVLFSCFTVLLVFAVVVKSAPNNSTSTAPAVAKPGVTNGTIVSNSTISGNKTASSEEDCEAEPEPISGAGGKNGTKTAGERQGKQLTPGDKDKYKSEPEAISEPISKTNATANASNPGGDAAKLQGNSSTTTAPPASGGATSSLWANVILATLLSSFSLSAL